MKIRKAVVTAAAPQQRTLPLQTVVDRDGGTKNALQVIVQEALEAGADLLGFNTWTGTKRYIDLAANSGWISWNASRICRRIDARSAVGASRWLCSQWSARSPFET